MSIVNNVIIHFPNCPISQDLNDTFVIFSKVVLCTESLLC